MRFIPMGTQNTERQQSRPNDQQRVAVQANTQAGVVLCPVMSTAHPLRCYPWLYEHRQFLHTFRFEEHPHTLYLDRHSCPMSNVENVSKYIL